MAPCQVAGSRCRKRPLSGCSAADDRERCLSQDSDGGNSALSGQRRFASSWARPAPLLVVACLLPSKVVAAPGVTVVSKAPVMSSCHRVGGRVQWVTDEIALAGRRSVPAPECHEDVEHLSLRPRRQPRRAKRQSSESAGIPPVEADSPVVVEAAAAASIPPANTLTFLETMIAGAVSRSVAQTAMQPANVIKTLLQGQNTAKQLEHLSFKLLTRGAGAQLVLSLPHGALNFATLEMVKSHTARIFPFQNMAPVLDFFSSAVATTLCSVFSTPQMVITDRIMAGIYPNLLVGVKEIATKEGVRGFYSGWFPALAQKVPSYGLTWVFFQQFKNVHHRTTHRDPSNMENFMLGAAAAAATVCIMIPLDTVKTRIVTQGAGQVPGSVPYKGLVDCIQRIMKEEGVGALYRSLTPRLVSVVPMIGIQFGTYEFMKKQMLERHPVHAPKRRWRSPLRRMRSALPEEPVRELLDELELTQRPFL